MKLRSMNMDIGLGYGKALTQQGNKSSSGIQVRGEYRSVLLSFC